MKINEPERITVQQRFANDWGMPIIEVGRLVKLAKLAGDANEHYSNGDPFPGISFFRDKNENARRWEKEVDRITDLITDLVKPYGFTAVVYTGLGPTLKRGEQFVEVPY